MTVQPSIKIVAFKDPCSRREGSGTMRRVSRRPSNCDFYQDDCNFHIIFQDEKETEKEWSFFCTRVLCSKISFSSPNVDNLARHGATDVRWP